MRGWSACLGHIRLSLCLNTYVGPLEIDVRGAPQHRHTMSMSTFANNDRPTKADESAFFRLPENSLGAVRLEPAVFPTPTSSPCWR